MSNYITQIILALILALAAFLGTQVRSLYRKYITTEIKKSVCKTAVLFVEQVYKDIHGPEKLKAAMTRASAMLQEYGIEISDLELTSLLEAAVREFINSFATDDAKGKHEGPQFMYTPAPAPSLDGVAPDPVAYDAAAAETGGSASLDEIIADLKDAE